MRLHIHDLRHRADGWRDGRSGRTLAGDSITAKLSHAPGNNAAIGGIKVAAATGWFAARPSGTENLYKIYAESFQGEAHLDAIVAETAARHGGAAWCSDAPAGGARFTLSVPRTGA